MSLDEFGSLTLDEQLPTLTGLKLQYVIQWTKAGQAVRMTFNLPAELEVPLIRSLIGGAASGLGIAARKVSRCKNERCDKLFLPARGHALFCSRRCGSARRARLYQRARRAKRTNAAHGTPSVLLLQNET